MYRVIMYDGHDNSAGVVIHSPYVSNQKIRSGAITQVVGGIDTFNFVINMASAAWGIPKPLKTTVRVINIKTGKVEFEGRVLKPKQVMTESGDFSIGYQCESYLAYLLDSTQRHGEYHDMTVRAFFEVMINNHNSQVEPHKRFKVGVVNVTNSTDNVYRYLGYADSYSTIIDKLVSRLGGYIQVRNEIDGLYIDYLEEVGKHSETVIRFRRNLKSMSREIDPSEVITRLVPLGAEIDSENEEDTDASKARINIKTVNGGKDYLDDLELIKEFGIVEKPVIFDDVNVLSILLNRGKSFLAAQKATKNSFELTPLDLSYNELEADSINKGDWYRVDNQVFGINEPLQVIKKTINVVNPIDINISIGDKFKTLTEYQAESNSKMKRYDDINSKLETQNQVIRNLKQDVSTVGEVVDNINIEINNGDIPGLNQSILDLNAVVDALNVSVGNMPTYDLATEYKDGLMSAQQVSKLSTLQVYDVSSSIKTGLMSATDKIKLDKILINETMDLGVFMQDFLDLKALVESMA